MNLKLTFIPYPEPISILTGLLRIFYVKCYIFDENVAENNRVYLSGLICPKIDSICGSKPKLNILSASSRTTYVHLKRLVAFFFIISISLPLKVIQ